MKRGALAVTILRAKSMRFFLVLEGQFGKQAFHNAMRDLLYARKERDFNQDDLIAAFDAETHQNTAAFEQL